jgi:asparagine synthase (glutamine-hydrolysing)
LVDTDHTEKYFVSELRRLLEDTIEIQMRCDVPIGTTLSGGLDSSTITTLASQKYDGRLKTFTGAFKEGPEFDEREYAYEVAKHCKVEMFRVYPTETQFIEYLPQLVYFMDEPAAGPGLFPQYIVSKTASEEVKVTLGGQGGDEIFGGYARYVVAYLEQAIKGAIYETNVEGEHIVSLQSILPNLPALKKYVPMLRRFWQAELFEPMDLRYFRLINRCDGDWSTISQDFQESYDLHDVFAKFQMVFNHPDTLSYYNKMVHFDLVASLPALLQVEDRVSMAASLESRVPLLDHRLVQLVLSMSPQTKFKGAEMKYVLKRAVNDLLPPKILKRKDKMGFPVPLHLWARNNVSGFFQDILLSKACRERGIFDPDGVKRLIENEEAFGRHLWGLVNLELWFRQFID